MLFGQLERFLVEAGVEDSWHGKYSSRAHGMVLQGGVHVVCKPAEGGHDDQHIKNEAAVWATAKQLDWTNLMGATVVRTLPLESGVNPVPVAFRLGHRSTRMIEQHYAHLLEPMDAAIAEELEKSRRNGDQMGTKSRVVGGGSEALGG